MRSSIKSVVGKILLKKIKTSLKIIFLNFTHKMYLTFIDFNLFTHIFSISGTKCLKNHPYDVIKISDYPTIFGVFSFPFSCHHLPHFYDVTWLIFKTLFTPLLISLLFLRTFTSYWIYFCLYRPVATSLL